MAAQPPPQQKPGVVQKQPQPQEQQKALENWFPFIEFMKFVTLLAIIVLISAVTVIWLGRRLKKPVKPARSSGGFMTQLRILYENGELSKDEYDKVRTKLRQNLKEELNVPEKKEEPPKEPPAPSAN